MLTLYILLQPSDGGDLGFYETFVLHIEELFLMYIVYRKIYSIVLQADLDC